MGLLETKNLKLNPSKGGSNADECMGGCVCDNMCLCMNICVCVWGGMITVSVCMCVCGYVF